MAQRLPLIVFALVMALIPLIPGIPPFWIVLLDNIGLAALVAMGLVLLTGVGGLTSFGQAAFCGFGAYTTAVLTTAYGVSPWLTLPLSLLVSGLLAVLLGLISYPLTAVAAIVVGTVEAFSSFYASNFKEVIVFTLIIPVLVLRSLAAPEVEEEHD